MYSLLRGQWVSERFIQTGIGWSIPDTAISFPWPENKATWSHEKFILSQTPKSNMDGFCSISYKWSSKKRYKCYLHPWLQPLAFHTNWFVGIVTNMQLCETIFGKKCNVIFIKYNFIQVFCSTQDTNCKRLTQMHFLDILGMSDWGKRWLLCNYSLSWIF